jgi:two-component system cell cycle response regulator
MVEVSNNKPTFEYKATETHERRSQRRRAVHKNGQIITGRNSSTVMCIVRDVSESGARLRMASTASIPETFLLLIKDENVIVPVQRVWSNTHEIGVKFTGQRRSAFC